MFEKVLVCLDGSPVAEEILPHIMEESRHFKKIILINVLDQPVVDIPIGVPGENILPFRSGTMLKDLKKALTRDRPKYLEEQAGPLRAKGADVEIAVLSGSPAETILNYAKDNGVTLIAMGTHGHQGWREITMGSTAEDILRRSHLPVLLISPEKKQLTTRAKVKG